MFRDASPPAGPWLGAQHLDHRPSRDEAAAHSAPSSSPRSGIAGRLSSRLHLGQHSGGGQCRATDSPHSLPIPVANLTAAQDPPDREKSQDLGSYKQQRGGFSRTILSATFKPQHLKPPILQNLPSKSSQTLSGSRLELPQAALSTLHQREQAPVLLLLGEDCGEEIAHSLRVCHLHLQDLIQFQPPRLKRPYTCPRPLPGNGRSAADHSQDRLPLFLRALLVVHGAHHTPALLVRLQDCMSQHQALALGCDVRPDFTHIVPVCVGPGAELLSFTKARKHIIYIYMSRHKNGSKRLVRRASSSSLRA